MTTRFFLTTNTASMQGHLALSTDNSIPDYSLSDHCRGFATREEADRAAGAATAVYATWYPDRDPPIQVTVFEAEVPEFLAEPPLTFPMGAL